jgi:hypothetical protein
LSEANVIGFAREMGIGLTFWHVSDGGYSSVVEIERSLRLLSNQVRHIVVKNFGRSKDFRQFEASEARRLLAELSGKVLELPELDAVAMYNIDRLGLSFWAAAHVSEGESALKPLERQRVKLWLERCYAGIDALEGVL